MDCTGDEAKLDECTQMILPLKQGRIKSTMEGLTVAGVTCSADDQCISPPIGGTDCINGDVRLSGDNAVNGAGTLEYCYKGLWSGFCILKEREATVACRQLGYTDFSSKLYSSMSIAGMVISCVIISYIYSCINIY